MPTTPHRADPRSPLSDDEWNALYRPRLAEPPCPDLTEHTRPPSIHYSGLLDHRGNHIPSTIYKSSPRQPYGFARPAAKGPRAPQ